MALRWRKSDIEKLKRLNTNVRRKAKRLEKKGITGVAPEIKKQGDFSTRAELNEYFKNAQRFTSRINQYVKNSAGAVFTKRQIERFKRVTRQANKRKEQELKKMRQYTYTIEGVDYNYWDIDRRIAQYDPKVNHFIPYTEDFSLIKSPEKLEQIIAKRQRDFRDIPENNRMLRDNYVRRLREYWKFNDIADIIEKVPPDQFYAWYLTEDISLNVWDSDQDKAMELQAQLEAVAERTGFRPQKYSR